MQVSLLDTAYTQTCTIEPNNFLDHQLKSHGKKIYQNKPTEENKVSRWQKETPLDLDINLMGRTINSFNIKMEQQKTFL